ncbi:MAG: RHS repeat-associated core domain-containing protein [Bacteriovoracia bacterium]
MSANLAKILSETGFYHYRARIYIPEIGRFAQSDPEPGVLDLPESVNNKYGYVGNNPINRIDPSGRSFWTSVWGKITIGIIIGAAVALTGGAAAGGVIAAAGITSAATGAVVGFAVGAATGFLVGGILTGLASKYLEEGSFNEGFWKGAIAGAIGGGIAGAFAGYSEALANLEKGSNLVASNNLPPDANTKSSFVDRIYSRIRTLIKKTLDTGPQRYPQPQGGVRGGLPIWTA